MADTPQVLLVCSSSKAHYGLVEAFTQRGITPISAYAVRDAEQALRGRPISFAVCSSELFDGTFRDILNILQQARLNIPVLVICRGEDADRAERHEAKRLGAIDCLPRPLGPAGIEAILQVVLRYL
jgi:DNA-binding NtrC family response regulator